MGNIPVFQGQQYNFLNDNLSFRMQYTCMLDFQVEGLPSLRKNFGKYFACIFLQASLPLLKNNMYRIRCVQHQYVLTSCVVKTFERLIVKYTMFYQSMTNVKPVNREALLFQQQLCSLQVVLQLWKQRYTYICDSEITQRYT